MRPWLDFGTGSSLVMRAAMMPAATSSAVPTSVPVSLSVRTR